MKLIINTSTHSSTGVCQVAVSFLNECKNFTSNEYHVFLSSTVENEIDKKSFPANFYFYSFPHPLYGVKGFLARKKLRKLEKAISPDCTFSVFGPSYWTPLSPHLMGYAHPHYVYPDSPIFDKMSFLNKIKVDLLKTFHMYFLKRNGKYYVSETVDVSQRLVKLLDYNKDHVYTVSNTYNNYFDQKTSTVPKLLPKKNEGEFRLLSLCSLSPHKNLTILNKVIPLLNEQVPNHTIKFVLTIDSELYEKHFEGDVKKSIINLGRIPIADCPQLYTECDALFLPTLLECFSANYPEAMKMKRPIITSDLSFATGVCGDAALYFDPLDEKGIVASIEKIYDDPNLRNKLIAQGEKQLESFLTSKERTEKYLNICKNIA